MRCPNPRCNKGFVEMIRHSGANGTKGETPGG